MNQETKQIFSLRKFKTGTHSALLAKYGIVLAVTTALIGAGSVVSADETVTGTNESIVRAVKNGDGTVSMTEPFQISDSQGNPVDAPVDSTIVTTVAPFKVQESENPNPATNLKEAQPLPTTANQEAPARADTSTGEVSTVIESPALDEAVDQAQDAGVKVADPTTEIVTSKNDADRKYTEQVSDINQTVDQYQKDKEDYDKAVASNQKAINEAPSKVKLKMVGEEFSQGPQGVGSGDYKNTIEIDNSTGKFKIIGNTDDGVGIIGHPILTGKLNYTTIYDKNKDQTVSVVTSVTFDQFEYQFVSSNRAVNRDISYSFSAPDGTLIHKASLDGMTGFTQNINKTIDLGHTINLNPNSSSAKLKMFDFHDDWIIDSWGHMYFSLENTNSPIVDPVAPTTPTVHPVHYKVVQTPKISKSVTNEDGTNVNNKMVPKASTDPYTLTLPTVKAGRPVYKQEQVVITDPLPSGYLVVEDATVKANPDYVLVLDQKTNTYTITLTEDYLAQFNANPNADFTFKPIVIVGSPQNDNGTYVNTYQLKLGDYAVYSNTVTIHTPGGENPSNGGSTIQPTKDVVDDKGVSINGKSVLPNSLLNYVAEQDFDQYKGIQASKQSIGKGFLYAEDYLDAALDGKSMKVNSITASNGDDVQKLLDMYHVLSKDTLSEELQKLIADSGISPVGEFYLWVAKDPQAFYDAYVQKGLDITYNLSFKIKKDFTEGEITNQTFQVDFGNGYYGNVVKNTLPAMVVHKDIQNKDGKSIDNGEVKIGDKVTYKLDGWVVPAGRGYDINKYVFVDMLQHSHDEYEGFRVEAKVDFKLADGTEIKAGDDLSKYIETTYNPETGRLESRFKSEFLSQIPRDSEFGSDGYITVKRIKSGEVVNEYTLIVNDAEVLSNKVVTRTPEQPTPPTPPTPNTPVQAAAVLPNTGETGSIMTVIGGFLLSGLGLVGIRKRKED